MYREIRPYANSIWDDNNNTDYLVLLYIIQLASQQEGLGAFRFFFKELLGMKQSRCVQIFL